MDLLYHFFHDFSRPLVLCGVTLKLWIAGQLSFILTLKNGTADTIGIESGAKLADVERESENEKLCLSLLFSAGEKSSESVIFLDHTKSPLDLYRTIYTQQYTVRCTDAKLSVTFLLIM